MWTSARELFIYRSMLWSLVLSELRTRYKGSVLGFLWTFVNPLLMLLVYSIVFSTVMKVNIPHYTVFMFIGLLAWNMFSTGTLSAVSVIVRQSSLIKKIYFPREILPLSVVCGSAINYLLTLVILVPTLLFTGFYPTPTWVLLLPLILLEVLFTAGLAMLFAALNVYFRDLEHMLGIFMMLWFYLTPVLYPISMVPNRISALFQYNPISGIVMFYQDIFYYRIAPELGSLVYTIIVSIVVFFAGWYLFKRLSRRFAEEV